MMLEPKLDKHIKELMQFINSHRAEKRKREIYGAILAVLGTVLLPTLLYPLATDNGKQTVDALYFIVTGSIGCSISAIVWMLFFDAD